MTAQVRRAGGPRAHANARSLADGRRAETVARGGPGGGDKRGPAAELYRDSPSCSSSHRIAFAWWTGGQAFTAGNSTYSSTGYYTSARSHACMLMFMHMHADGRSSAAASACQPSSRSRFINQPPADRFRLPRALQSCCTQAAAEFRSLVLGAAPGAAAGPVSVNDARGRPCMPGPALSGRTSRPGWVPRRPLFPSSSGALYHSFDDGSRRGGYVARKELTGDAGTSCSCVCTDPQTGWNWRPI